MAKTNAQINRQNEALVVTIVKYFFASNLTVHMVHGNINTNDETSHTTSNAKKRSLKISDYFSKQNGKPSLSGE